jgi:hypothetical protein
MTSSSSIDCFEIISKLDNLNIFLSLQYFAMRNNCSLIRENAMIKWEKRRVRSWVPFLFISVIQFDSFFKGGLPLSVSTYTV